MKPAPVGYSAPNTLENALATLAEHSWSAKPIAGGQSLVPLLNFRMAEPELLIDLNQIAELSFIDAAESARGDGPAEPGGLRIGAMTRLSTLEESPLIADRAPLLAAALPFIAHPQIRNRSTLGGSLAHADPAAELPAIALALRARIRAQSASGARWIEAEDFFISLMATDLAPEELVTEISLPALPPSTGCAFLEIARRRGDYAHVGVAAVITTDSDRTIESARLVYMSVGETPLVASRAGSLLEGHHSSTAPITEAAKVAAQDEIHPSSDIHASADYKRHLAEVLTCRAVRQALEQL